MNRRQSVGLIVASLLLAIATTVLWLEPGAGDERADLVGDAIFTVSTTATSLVEPSTTVAPVPQPSAPTTTSTTIPSSVLFSRLVAPDVGIDAPVIPVGLEDDGSMELPGETQAGWYYPGVRPGSATGSSVVAAHIDYNGKPGVFFNLGKLQAGSEVQLDVSDGQTHTYVVMERFQVSKNALQTEELFRTNGAHVLTLVTCGGSYDRSDRSYSDNIVIRAVPA